MKSPLLGPVQLYTVISPEPPEKSRASDRMSDEEGERMAEIGCYPVSAVAGSEQLPYSLTVLLVVAKRAVRDQKGKGLRR